MNFSSCRIEDNLIHALRVFLIFTLCAIPETPLPICEHPWGGGGDSWLIGSCDNILWYYFWNGLLWSRSEHLTRASYWRSPDHCFSPYVVWFLGPLPHDQVSTYPVAIRYHEGHRTHKWAWICAILYQYRMLSHPSDSSPSLPLPLLAIYWAKNLTCSYPQTF